MGSGPRGGAFLSDGDPGMSAVKQGLRPDRCGITRDEAGQG